MRYVEVGGFLRRVLVVVKTRAGDHCKEIREFGITVSGLAVAGSVFSGYSALTSGLPEKEEKPPRDLPL
jgi:circadian clock protein KaiC